MSMSHLALGSPARSSSLTFRDCFQCVLAEPKVSDEILRRLPEWFPDPEHDFPLDPTYEPEAERGSAHSEHEEIFGCLQNCARAHLIVPVDQPHMYHAAINSTACRLTPLGRFYWKLGKRRAPVRTGRHHRPPGHRPGYLGAGGRTSSFARAQSRGARSWHHLARRGGRSDLRSEAVLAQGGSLTAVLPCAGYERSFTVPAALDRYRKLKQRANEIVELDFDTPGEEAYWAAGQNVVDLADEMLAVWDGKESGGLGGTADVVAFARRKGVPVTVIWPAGSSRC